MVIVGPTASGKSDFAVSLAKKLGGEVVSADSRQVYKHLDIGSNKVAGKWQKKIFIYKKIPHYCIDFTNPKRKFTVIDFKKCAEKAIKDINKRGKMPILVGGTGFYIDAVIDDIVIPAIPPNWKLRRMLERKSVIELFRILKKKDPQRAKTIESKNKRRLIRAVEIIKATKKPIPTIIKNGRSSKFDFLIVGIEISKEKLRKRIIKRTQQMLKRGLVAEIKKLKKIGLSSKRISEFGFEYKYPLLYLEKKITKKELENILNKENLRYARRQITWFKRDKRIKWIPITRTSLSSQ